MTPRFATQFLFFMCALLSALSALTLRLGSALGPFSLPSSIHAPRLRPKFPIPRPPPTGASSSPPRTLPRPLFHRTGADWRSVRADSFCWAGQRLRCSIYEGYIKKQRCLWEVKGKED